MVPCGLTIRVQRIDRSCLGGMRRFRQPLTRTVSWLRIQTLHSSGRVIDQPESTQRTGVATAAQDFLGCPKALRRLGLRPLLGVDGASRLAQKAGVRAVQTGERCGSQLTRHWSGQAKAACARVKARPAAQF